MEVDDCLTDPNESSLDSPPRPSQEAPRSLERISSPKKFLAWTNKPIFDFKGHVFSLLERFGVSKESSGLRKGFRIQEISAASGDEDKDILIDKLRCREESPTSAVENVASASKVKSSSDFELNVGTKPRILPCEGDSSIDSGSEKSFKNEASASKDESSSDFELNVAPEPHILPCEGDSSTDSGSEVSFTNEASANEDEFSIDFEINVTPKPHASPSDGQNSIDPVSDLSLILQESASKDESLMEFEITFEPKRYESLSDDETSVVSGSDESLTTQAPAFKDNTWMYNGSLMSSESLDLASIYDRLVKEIDNNLAKYLGNKEGLKQAEDALNKLERAFAIKRYRRLTSVAGRLNLQKLIQLWNGVRELKFLAKKISKYQNYLCIKLDAILKRKKKLNPFLREGQDLSLIADKDVFFSYSLCWIHKNLILINKVLRKKRKYQKVFQIVRTKVQQQLDDF